LMIEKVRVTAIVISSNLGGAMRAPVDAWGHNGKHQLRGLFPWS